VKRFSVLVLALLVVGCVTDTNGKSVSIFDAQCSESHHQHFVFNCEIIENYEDLTLPFQAEAMSLNSGKKVHYAVPQDLSGYSDYRNLTLLVCEDLYSNCIISKDVIASTPDYKDLADYKRKQALNRRQLAEAQARNKTYASQGSAFVDNKEEIFISCSVINKGNTKTDKYTGYGYGEKVTVYQDVPDEEKFPIFFAIKGDSVKIESSINGNNANFSGTVQSKSDREIKINAKRHVGETWRIKINRVNGSINIMPMGFLGMLENYARASDNEAIRKYEGFCEDGSKRKF